MVSIVVPVYNSEKYLARCVGSLRAQTCDEIEMILVDDGSTDGSGEICEQAAAQDRRIVVIHQKNGGVSAARNAGIRQARGDYVMFVDADDELLPDAVEKLLETITQSRAQMVVGRHIHVRANGAERVEDDRCKAGRMEGEDFLKAVLADLPVGYFVWRILYQKEFISDLRFEEGCITGEDGIFIFRCAMKKPLVVITDDVVYRYYMNPDSVTHGGITRKKWDDVLSLLQKRRGWIAESFPHLQAECDFLTIKIHMMLLRNSCHVTGREWRACEKASLEQIAALRACYRKGTRRDDLFFWVLTHHLYRPYKALVQMKKRMK